MLECLGLEALMPSSRAAIVSLRVRGFSWAWFF